VQEGDNENDLAANRTKKFFKDFVHFHSNKAEGNTITFSSFEVMPEFLQGTLPAPMIPEKVTNDDIFQYIFLFFIFSLNKNRIV
jgi:hypothetical protein